MLKTRLPQHIELVVMVTVNFFKYFNEFAPEKLGCSIQGR